MLLGTKCSRHRSEPQQGGGQRGWHQTPEKLPVPAAVSDQSSPSRSQCVFLPRLWGLFPALRPREVHLCTLELLIETTNGGFLKNNLKKALCSPSLQRGEPVRGLSSPNPMYQLQPVSAELLLSIPAEMLFQPCIYSHNLETTQRYSHDTAGKFLLGCFLWTP